MSTEKDYTGVATWQLRDVFNRYDRMGITKTAMVIGMDERDFRKIVVDAKYKFTTLRQADRILTAMGLNISGLALAGEITIIPAGDTHAPRKMAEDEFWVLEADAPRVRPTSREILDRAHELARLREEMISKA